MKVELEKIVDAIEQTMQEVSFYYNKKTGEISFVSFEFSSDLDKELIEEIEYSDDYLMIPDQYERHDHKLMQNFIKTITDEEVADILWSAINRKGAFRNFKDLIYHYALADGWYKYQRAAYRELAIAWCKRNEINYY